MLKSKMFTALFAVLFLTCFTFGMMLMIVSKTAACGFFALTMVAGVGAVIADAGGRRHD